MTADASVDRACDELETRLGYRFENKKILRCALSHASAINVQERVAKSYERLEFLGDRVLGLVIAELLFEAHPDEAEGQLARRFNALVRRETCAEIAGALDLGAAMILGEAEERTGGRQKEALLADMCEALIAALYLDGGFGAAKDFIHTHWTPRLNQKQTGRRDAKTALQEWAQQSGYDLPVYTLAGRSGPDHAPEFTIAVMLPGLKPEEGIGSSKRVAEQNAAEALLRREGVWP